MWRVKAKWSPWQSEHSAPCETGEQPQQAPGTPSEISVQKSTGPAKMLYRGPKLDGQKTAHSGVFSNVSYFICFFFSFTLNCKYAYCYTVNTFFFFYDILVTLIGKFSFTSCKYMCLNDIFSQLLKRLGISTSFPLKLHYEVISVRHDLGS